MSVRSTILMSTAPSFRRERQEGDVPRPLDGPHELPLVPGAGSRDPSREDLSALGSEPLQQSYILVVDVRDLFLTELAEFLFSKKEFLLELFFLGTPISVPGIHLLSHLPRHAVPGPLFRLLRLR